MTQHIDPEALVAYVDGQLDQSETARVEAALAEDPEARETVRRLRESAELLRSAFNEPLNAPVPARVLEAFHAMAGERSAGFPESLLQERAHDRRDTVHDPQVQGPEAGPRLQHNRRNSDGLRE